MMTTNLLVSSLVMLIICRSLSTDSGVVDNEYATGISQIYINLLGIDFDLDYVTKEYLKVCPHLKKCRDGDASFSDIVTEIELYELPVFCPTCSCEQDCLINDECCPNAIYGYLNYDCVSSVKRRGRSWFNETSYNMIASCPRSWLARNNLSNENGSVFPVTSYTTGLTYQTREFAECNGDAHSLVMWNTTYHCLKTDPNLWPLAINSFEEFIQNLQEKKCEIRLSVTNPKVPRQAVCDGELYLKEKLAYKPKQKVDKCNTTGLLEKFNPYIDFACRRLSLSFDIYKNVFCFICNPGLSIQHNLKKPLISTCDSTYSNSKIENACKTRERSAYYLPYKNVFCRVCSTVQRPFVSGNSGMQGTWIVIENLDEHIVAKTIGRLFRIENYCDANMTHFDDELFYKTSFHETIRVNEPKHSCIIPLHIQYVKGNIHEPDCDLNNSHLVTNHLKAQRYNCTDVLETDTTNAKEELLFAYMMHIYLCHDSVKSNNICTSFTTNEINSYSVSPNRTGKALSCFVCKMGDVYDLDTPFNVRTTGFDFLIRVACPTLLQAELFLDTFSLFEIILENNCSLWFYPTGARAGEYKDYLENFNDCIDFPWIDIRTCSNSFNSHYLGSYRKLFSVSNTDWTALLQVKKRQHSHNPLQCLDTIDVLTNSTNNSCREIFCSEGHVLVNNSCKHEFETYVNVLYELDFQLVVTDVEERTALVIDANSDQAIALHLAIINVGDVCDSVKDIIRNQMSEHVSYSFHACVVNTETICSENNIAELVIGSTIEISVYIMIHFTKELSRVEESLIDSLTNAPGTNFVSGSGVKLTHVRQIREVHTQFCFRLYYGSDSMFISKQIRVSKLLICPQIQLLESEYNIDNMTGTLKILKTKMKTDNYYIKDGHARVCLEDFTANYEIVLEISSLQRLYKIVDNVCTILSLLFMFLTFVTYLIFSSLRTVPGLNNMSLIFSLFFAQSTLKFGIWQPTTMTLCPVFGILIHFFWLSTFCSMNVCSFHMYRVFSSKILSIFTRKTSLTYLLYTYFVPAAIVLSTISVHLTLSFGQDFGYGKTICFLTNYITTIISFICPCVFVFLLNILFFSKTFISMRRTLNNPRLRRSSERRDVFVYLRLSTLLGITWPLLIVDAFFQMSVFSIFALTFNTLQGFFVFISFVCNRRVLQLYRICLFGNTEKLTTVTQSKVNANTKSFNEEE